MTRLISYRFFQHPVCWPLIICALLIIADQTSKAIVVHQFFVGESKPIWPFFSLTLVYNTGISFSLFHDTPYARWLFSVLACAVAAFIIGSLWRYAFRYTIFQRLSYACIAAGALGNAIDRIRLGAVVDFFHFHAGAYYFPIFNIADITINAGIVLLCINIWMDIKKQTTAHSS